jgi:hypothetical protein
MNVGTIGNQMPTTLALFDADMLTEPYWAVISRLNSKQEKRIGGQHFPPTLPQTTYPLVSNGANDLGSQKES